MRFSPLGKWVKHQSNGLAEHIYLRFYFLKIGAGGLAVAAHSCIILRNSHLGGVRKVKDSGIRGVTKGSLTGHSAVHCLNI